MSNASYVTEEELFALMQSIDQSDVKPPRAQPVFGPGCHSHQPGNEASFRENVTHHLIDRKSFLAFPQIREEVVANALAQIPDALKTDARDTKETLIQKIRSIGWFDEQFPLQGGGRRGKKRVRLTATDYSTPRRKSWSVVVQDAHENNSGSLVRTMYSYGKPNSRIRVETNATEMPVEIGTLGIHLFLSAHHLLSDACKSSPPNHCQMLGHYGLFDSKVGRHKDDHEIGTLHEVLLGSKTEEEAVKTTKGAMVPGSDVLIFSNGPLHVFFSWCLVVIQCGPSWVTSNVYSSQDPCD